MAYLDPPLFNAKEVDDLSELWNPLREAVEAFGDRIRENDVLFTGVLPEDIRAIHNQKISDALPKNPRGIWFPKPLHHLLSYRTEYDLEFFTDILEILTSFGFNVNQYDHAQRTCLIVALQSGHFKAVRWLSQHGANCTIGIRKDEHCFAPNPITILAGRCDGERHYTARDASLDLFDLFNTSENVNYHSKSSEQLPLHVALSSRSGAKVALHLIQMGANVSLADPQGRLPIELFIQNYSYKYQDELLFSLIPSCSIHVLKGLCILFGEDGYFQGQMSNFMHQLVQRIDLCEPISANIAIGVEDRRHQERRWSVPSDAIGPGFGESFLYMTVGQDIAIKNSL